MVDWDDEAADQRPPRCETRAHLDAKIFGHHWKVAFVRLVKNAYFFQFLLDFQ